MKRMAALAGRVAIGLLMSPVLMGMAQDKKAKTDKDEKVVVSGTPAAAEVAVVQDSVTEGSVTLASGQTVNYRAVAGTLTVGATDQQDATIGLDGKMLPDSGEKAPDKDKPEEAPPTARIFYTAYFKKDAVAEQRPVTFLYNGGPGSATMWLHMGSFGPRRVITTDTEHDAAAPYKIVNNQYSLLDVSDVVFIDAPGTGFSRIFGKDKDKAFWGTDQDAHAFERFIRRFLTKFDRWNSPKYLFGESYGTPRSAVLSAALHNVDLNGIILLSAILSFDNSIDGPVFNPGVDQAYALGLPTFAATAFYHHKLPTQPPALEPFLAEVEKFALGEYMAALLKGSELTDGEKHGDGREAAWLYRVARGISIEGKPPRVRRSVLEGAADGSGHHDGAAGHAVQRAGHRSAERRRGLRPAERCDQLGVHDGDQCIHAG